MKLIRIVGRVVIGTVLVCFLMAIVALINIGLDFVFGRMWTGIIIGGFLLIVIIYIAIKIEDDK